jgi:hypothetical protein
VSADVTHLADVRRARSQQVDPEIHTSVEAHAGRVETEFICPDGVKIRLFQTVEQALDWAEQVIEAAHDAAALAELEQEGSAKGRRR